MKAKEVKNKTEITKSLFIAFSILILHLLLLGSIGLMVIFFQGVSRYLPWIFLAGSSAIIASGYLFIIRLKKRGTNLNKVLNMQDFRNRSVEVSILGGFASLKIGKPYNISSIENHNSGQKVQLLEDLSDSRIMELVELASMLKNGIITEGEYKKFKPGSCNSKDNI
jgi:hypothetical protein